MPNRSRLQIMTIHNTGLWCAPVRLLLAGLVMAGLVAPVQAEYVSDDLSVELRSGSSTEYRIINFLKGGSSFEVVETSDKFTKVRTANGTEGWISNQYVVSEPGARSKLKDAEARIEKLQANLDEATAGSGNVFKKLETAEADITTLTTSLEEARADLARVRAASAGAVEAADKLKSLEELNARLRNELRDLAADRERLAANLEERWLLIGAGLLFGGLLLGVIIKSRPRRSAWS